MQMDFRKRMTRRSDHVAVTLDTGSENMNEDQKTDMSSNYVAALLDSVSDAVISTDLHFVIKSWNRGAEAVYGWRAHEAIGKRVGDLLQTTYPEGTDPQQVLDHFQRDAFWEGDVVQKHKSGRALHIHSAVSAIKDEEGRSIGVVAVNRDISERKHAEERQLELALERAKISFIERFLNDASHDFRTPLSTINTSLYLLDKVDDAEKRRKHIMTIARQTAKIEKLISDILTLIRLEGAHTSATYALDVNRLVGMSLASFKENLLDKNLELRVDLSPQLLVAQINSGEMHLAISRILENAVDYNRPGGTISVSTYPINGEVVIEVADSGIGILEADIPYIFDRFYRADKARSADRGGAGLGLSIARKIVEMHHGRIEVKSEPDVGSAFYIILPAV